jgi:hypothetical protein
LGLCRELDLVSMRSFSSARYGASESLQQQNVGERCDASTEHAPEWKRSEEKREKSFSSSASYQQPAGIVSRFCSVENVLFIAYNVARSWKEKVQGRSDSSCFSSARVWFKAFAPVSNAHSESQMRAQRNAGLSRRAAPPESR